VKAINVNKLFISAFQGTEPNNGGSMTCLFAATVGLLQCISTDQSRLSQKQVDCTNGNPTFIYSIVLPFFTPVSDKYRISDCSWNPH